MNTKELDEVKKIKSRLDGWIKKSFQINSKILRTYMQLHMNQAFPVTVKQLSSKLEEIKTFHSNFNQMKLISDKNHGKVFEVNENLEISLWKPVEEYILSKKIEITK